MVKRAVEEDEPFPRGGGNESQPGKQDDASEVVLKDSKEPDKKKRKKTKANDEKEEDDPEVAAVTANLAMKNVNAVRFQNLVEGALLLGAVSEVLEQELIINLPFNLIGFVGREHASEPCKPGDELPPLEKLYHAGQLVVCVVIKLEQGHNGAGRRIELSLRPTLSNAGLDKESLSKGMFLPALVQSEEEHVFSLDFCFQGVRGTLLKKNASKPPPLVGAVIQVCINPVNSTTLKCTTEATTTIPSAPLKVDLLKPGFLVNGRIEKVMKDKKSSGEKGTNNNGLLLSFCGSLSGVVHWHHQSIAAEATDTWTAKQRVTARILAVVPGHKTAESCHLSLLPHIHDWKECGSSLDCVEIGQQLDATVVDLEPRLGCRLACQVPDPIKGVIKPILGFCHVSRLSDKKVDKVEDAGAPGAKKVCRVLGHNLLDNSLVLTMQASALKDDEIVSIKQLELGQIVRGNIMRIASYGVFVSLSGFVKGLVPVSHLTDVPLKEVPDRFKVGDKLKCRVLARNDLKRTVTLTAKKTLVREPYALTKFEQARKNYLVTGFVGSVHEYGTIIHFFGNAYGLIPKREFEDVEPLAKGVVVRTRIAGTEKERQRIRLSLDLEQGCEPGESLLSDTRLAPGTIVDELKVVQSLKDGFLVDFSLGVASGKPGRGFVPTLHLSDSVDQANARHRAITDALKSAKSKSSADDALIGLGEGVVLDGSYAFENSDQQKEGEKPKRAYLLSVKPSMRLAATEEDFVTDLAGLQAPKIYTGYVKHAKDCGVFVCVGAWRVSGLAPKHQLIADKFVENPEKEFTPGQTVRAMVQEVDAEKKRYSVDLRVSVSSSSSAPLLQREAKALQDFFKLQEQLFAEQVKSEPWSQLWPGRVLDGVVQKTKEYGALLKVSGFKGLTVLAVKDNCPPEGVSVGQEVRCAILDLDLEKSILDVTLVQDFVAALSGVSESPGKKRKRTPLEDGLQALRDTSEASVVSVLQKPGYTILTSRSPPAVLFAPPWEKGWVGPPAKNVVVSYVPEKLGPFMRILAQCPIFKKRDKKSAVPKISRPGEELQIGSPITMKVSSARGNQVVCSAPVGLWGYLHVTQMFDAAEDGAELEQPIDKLKGLSTIEARVLRMKRRTDESNKSSWHLELTCRPSLMKSQKQSAIEQAEVRWNNLKKGARHVGVITEVKKGVLWIELNSSVRGSIGILDITTDLGEARGMLDGFKVGQLVDTEVLHVLPQKKILDLALVSAGGADRSKKTVPRKDTKVVLARVEKLEDVKGKGIAAIFRLPGRKSGFVHVTELFDSWTQFPARRLKPGQIWEVKKLTTNAQDNERVELSLRASSVHGKKPDTSERRLLDAADLTVGQKVCGYVVNANAKGVFVALSRTLVGRIQLRALSKDPVMKDAVERLYPAGTLIRDAVVMEVNVQQSKVELSMTGDTQESTSQLTVSQLSVGDVVSAIVKRRELFGLFVRIENSKVDALVHKTEISDGLSVSLESYEVGSRIPRCKVVKIENGKVNLGIKASLFEDDDDEDDDAEDEGDENMDVEEADEVDVPDADMEEEPAAKGRQLDSDEEELPWLRRDSKTAVGGQKLAVEPNFKVPSIDFGSATDAIVSDPFAWSDLKLGKDLEGESSDELSGEEDDGEASAKKLSKRQKAAKKRADAEELDRREAENAENRWASDPRGVEDFERLLLTEGDSSVVWIRYMAFHLKMSDLEKARSVAERAVKHISFSEDKERLNVWVAYLNLESTFGSEQKEQEIFRRAGQHNDAKKVHLQMARIHQRNQKIKEARQVLDAACKRFGHSKKVWISYLQMLYESKQLEVGRELLPKALVALPKRKHPQIVVKAAILEYQNGSAERGRSVFEGLIATYPKRTDLWSVYIDQHVKANTPPEVAAPQNEEVRKLFERCITMDIKAFKMKFFFKKWLDFEKRWGTEADTEQVREKAREYVEQQG